MARSKKADEQKQLAPAVQPHLQQPINGPGPAPIMAPAPATPFSNQPGRVIDVGNFIRVRDSVRAGSISSSHTRTHPPSLPVFPSTQHSENIANPDGGDAINTLACTAPSVSAVNIGIIKNHQILLSTPLS